MTQEQTVVRKRRIPRIWKVIGSAAIIVGLLAAAFFARQKFLSPPYDPAMPTVAKYERLVRWISPGVELRLAVDVPRAFANPALRDGLSALVRGREGVAAELIAALLERQPIVGMLALVGELGDAGAPTRMAVIAQGKFDQQVLIPAIRTILAAGRAGLVSEKLGERTLYAESDVRDPFGFVILDREHLAVGSKAALVALFRSAPFDRRTLTVPPNAILFGSIALGPRLRTLLPPGVPQVSTIEVVSADGLRAQATIEGTHASEAPGLVMFVEGIRSLLLLQEEQNASLASLLRGISVENREGRVTLSCDLLPLVGLWASAP